MYRVPLRNLAGRVSRRDKKTIRPGEGLNVPQDDFWETVKRPGHFPVHDGFTSDFATMYGYLSNSRDEAFVVLRECRGERGIRSERNINRPDATPCSRHRAMNTHVAFSTANSFAKSPRCVFVTFGRDGYFFFFIAIARKIKDFNKLYFAPMQIAEKFIF